MDELNSILIFIFFFLPGFISIKIWSLFHIRKEVSQHILIYDCIFFSILNFVILSPIAIPLFNYGWYKINFFLFVLFILLYDFIAPFSWPFLWRYLRNQKFLYKYFQLPYSTAWDYFIDQRKSCFVLIHLYDDSMIGGYYGLNSYATPSIDEGSIYLERVYKINSDGTFGDEIQNSFGLVISKCDYKYLELFYDTKEHDMSNNGKSQNGKGPSTHGLKPISEGVKPSSGSQSPKPPKGGTSQSNKGK